MFEKERFYFMDWLRILAMGLVFLVHVSMPFVPIQDAWHIQFDQTNMIFTMLAGFAYQWIMHLFFFMAGAGTFLAFAYRTPRRYLFERVQRLLIPFVFGSLAFSGFQVYLSQMSVSGNPGSFLKFYPKLYEGCISDQPGILRIECFSLHLWFLGFLFLYSILTLPLIKWLRCRFATNALNQVASFSERPGVIFIYFVPTAFIQILLRSRYPEHTNWSDFFLWWMYYIFGYLFISNKRFLQAILHHRYIALAGGLVSMLIMPILLLNLGFAEEWEIHPVFSGGYALYQVLRSLNTWMWVLFFLGIGLHHLEFNHRFLQYGREALLPFYVLHQIVIVPLAFGLLPWHPPILIKFLSLGTVSFLLTIGLYEFIIKRFNGLRFLFGMRLKIETRN